MHTKNNQTGSIPIIIVVVLLLAGLGFGGWRVYSSRNSQKDNQATQQTEQTAEKVTEEKPADFGLKPGEIIKLPESIVLVYPADLAKLPATVPQSFKDYMTDKLKKNETSGDCVGMYSVKSISTVNIDGGVGDVERDGLDSGTEFCGGGAHVVWSFKDNKWQESGFQSIDMCSHLVEVGIYEEFMNTCYNPETEDEAPNPMGSIKQLAQ